MYQRLKIYHVYYRYIPFIFQALSIHENLHSKPSEPLVITWPGVKSPVLKRAPTVHSNAVRVQWETPYSTEGVCCRQYKVWIKDTEDYLGICDIYRNLVVVFCLGELRLQLQNVVASSWGSLPAFCTYVLWCWMHLVLDAHVSCWFCKVAYHILLGCKCHTQPQ
jgi:hypothetical protein